MIGNKTDDVRNNIGSDVWITESENEKFLGAIFVWNLVSGLLSTTFVENLPKSYTPLHICLCGLWSAEIIDEFFH